LGHEPFNYTFELTDFREHHNEIVQIFLNHWQSSASKNQDMHSLHFKVKTM